MMRQIRFFYIGPTYLYEFAFSYLLQIESKYEPNNLTNTHTEKIAQNYLYNTYT